MLVLWQFERCPNCRRFRDVLTELCLDFVAVNAPRDHPEKDDVMLKLFPTAKVPALWNTMTGELIQGEARCIEYARATFSPKA